MAFSQPIVCHGVVFETSKFAEDSSYSYSQQYLVKHHVLEPITTSKSDIEIRFYDVSSPNIFSVFVIRCQDQDVHATLLKAYSVDEGASSEFSDGSFQDVSTAYHRANYGRLWLKVRSNLRPASGNWESFFKALQTDDIIAMPGGKALLSLITRQYPLIDVTHSATYVVEVKMGKKLRNFDITFAYGREAENVAEYRKRNDLINLIYTLISKDD